MAGERHVIGIHEKPIQPVIAALCHIGNSTTTQRMPGDDQVTAVQTMSHHEVFKRSKQPTKSFFHVMRFIFEELKIVNHVPNGIGNDVVQSSRRSTKRQSHLCNVAMLIILGQHVCLRILELERLPLKRPIVIDKCALITKIFSRKDRPPFLLNPVTCRLLTLPAQQACLIFSAPKSSNQRCQRKAIGLIRTPKRIIQPMIAIKHQIQSIGHKLPSIISLILK